MTEKEFKELVLPSKDKLYRVALSMIGSPEKAEDILQDIFLKLWQMRNRLSEYRSVEGLAMTMIKNRCIDQLRSYRNRNKNDDPHLELHEAAGPDPLKKTELNESREALLRIFEQLPEQQRLVIHLRDIEQYEYEEIREITGMTVNNIRVTLSRARKKAREIYLKLQNYEDRKN